MGFVRNGNRAARLEGGWSIPFGEWGMGVAGGLRPPLEERTAAKRKLGALEEGAAGLENDKEIQAGFARRAQT